MEESSSETQVITKKDPKKVEQGGKLGKMSLTYKREKVRKELMENDDEEMRNHFFTKFKEENFSYLPYVLGSVAGITTLGMIVMFFRGKPTVVVESTGERRPPPKEEPKNFVTKYETFD